MAYVNVAEWSPEQVGEWLRGLDDVIKPYIHYFVEGKVDGKHLLHLSSLDFPRLNLTLIGHQAIVLQGVELLRNIHYHLDQENVQQLALRLSSKARSVYNELCIQSPSLEAVNGEFKDFEDAKEEIEVTKAPSKKEKVPTRILSGVVDVLSSVKSLVSWLHRTPFNGVEDYDTLKSRFVDLSIGLATIAQREFAFTENPASVIKERCFKLAEMADKIIQEYSDPLILQPASLDVVTIKKRTDDNWGLNLVSSYHGIHQISMIRALSPAHTCGKLMGDDQLVQVNYQTVVGWTSNKVTRLMQENPCEVILTVKKCPRHDTNNLTKIYFKPIRLPSKKRTYSPWTNKVLSPTKYDLQSFPNLEFIKSFDGRDAARRVVSTEPHPKSVTPPPLDGSSGGGTVINSSISDIGVQSASDSDDGSEFEDDAFLSDSEVGGSSSLNVRLFQPKPRPPVQRRATIPGATPRPCLSFDQMLKGFCQNQYYHPICTTESYIRNRNLPESTTRPHTCIGTEKKLPTAEALRDSVDLPFIDESDEKDDDKSNKDSFNDSVSLSSVDTKEIYDCPTVSIIVEESDEANRSNSKMSSPSNSPVETPNELHYLRRVSEDRPKLDKSYSSPTYDLDNDDPPDFIGQKSNPSSGFSFNATKPEISTHVVEENRPLERRNKYTEIPLLDASSISDQFSEKEVAVPPPPPPSPSPSPSPPSNSGIDYGGVAHLAYSTIPLSSLPTVGTFDHLYGVTGGKMSSASEVSAGAKTNSASSPFDECSYVLMTNSDSVLNNNNEAPDDTPESVSENGSQSDGNSCNVMLRQPISRSPVSWRRGFLLSGAGSRRISCRELGQGDHHGWLYRRKESKGFLISHRWEKRWFVLKKSDLYGYRDKESTKADSYIYLPGFYVCPASDIKSKRFAFKIYHSSGATFYFACDTAEERSRWMSQMGLSAISASGSRIKEHNTLDVPSEEAYYSETDDELDDKSPILSRALSPPHRISPGKDNSIATRFKGSSMTGFSNTRPSPLSSLGGVKSPGIRFLHSSKPSLGQPVPTSNFRSYIRVRDSDSRRSTSASDLLDPSSIAEAETEYKSVKDTQKNTKPVRRKGSLRERLKQIPASLTLDRKKGLVKTTGTSSQQSRATYRNSKSETALLDSPVKALSVNSSFPLLPNYMRPTHASKNAPKSSLDSDLLTRRGMSCSPTPSGGINSSKLYGVGRRGSIGGMSSGNNSSGSLSPRRGSLDCLSTSQAISPPSTPMKSLVGSNGALGSKGEYLEGSPEKIWINSLRSEGQKSRSPVVIGRPNEKKGTQVNRKSIEESIPERLKKTNQYYPILVKGKPEPMKPAFEMALTTDRKESNDNSLNESKLSISSPGKPEVPPRTKFLSPSERIFSPRNERNLGHSPSSHSSSSSPDQSLNNSEQDSSRNSRTKAPPNITINPTEESDGPKTPLKPTMGIAMIGKQRRTPGVLSPREVFFSSPPQSPKLFSPPSSSSSSRSYSPYQNSFASLPRSNHDVNENGIKAEKILPHYPGTEYPPTFEPETYTVNLPSSDDIYVPHNNLRGASPSSILRSPPQGVIYSPHRSSPRNQTSSSQSVQSQISLNRSVSSSQAYQGSYLTKTPPVQLTGSLQRNHGTDKRSPRFNGGTTSQMSHYTPRRSPRSNWEPPKRSPESSATSRQDQWYQGSLSPVKEFPPGRRASELEYDKPSDNVSPTNTGYVNISHVSSTLEEFNAKSYHHNIYVTSPCSQDSSPRSYATSTLPSNTREGKSPESTSNKRPQSVSSLTVHLMAPTRTSCPVNNEFQNNSYLPMDKVVSPVYMNMVSNHSEIKLRKDEV